MVEIKNVDFLYANDLSTSPPKIDYITTFCNVDFSKIVNVRIYDSLCCIKFENENIEVIDNPKNYIIGIAINEESKSYGIIVNNPDQKLTTENIIMNFDTVQLNDVDF